MEKFKTFKDEIAKRCRDNSACQPEYKRLLASEIFEQLFTVLKDNIGWVFSHNILDPDILLSVKEDANASDIWVNEDCKSGYLFVNNATVEASGNATVRAYGNATVEAYDNATVRASDNATVSAWGNATVSAYDNATVRAWGNATVRAYGNATVEAWGNAFTSSYFKIECKINENAIYRCESTKEIFVCKGAYKVIEQEETK